MKLMSLMSLRGLKGRYELTGRVVMVTGAAQGIGAALAALLHKCGANVALVDIQKEPLDLLQEDLGYPARGFTADVTDLASMESAVEEIVEHFGRLDVVVANAGANTFEPVATGDPQAFHRVIEVNLLGTYHTLRAAAPHVMRTRGYFQIMSSTASAFHSPLQAHYTASKAGVAAIADSFRLEVRGSGAEVGVVHPTFVKTAAMEWWTRHDPVGRVLWDGNQGGGSWSMVTVGEVVGAMVDGIERRARSVVVPSNVRPLLWFPAMFQPLLERSFTPPRVQEVIRASEESREAQGKAPSVS